MPTAHDLVAYEDDLVAQGIKENPAGSNNTIIGQRFGWNGVAWCAETQSVAIEAVFGRRLAWSAAVSEWITAAKRGDNGMRWVPADGWITAGMLVTYDFGNPRGNPSHFHIAMVRDPGTQARFQTDGGNEGDAMRQQWRDRTSVQGFISLPFDSSTPVPPTPTPVHLEDDMTFITEFLDWPGKLWLVFAVPVATGHQDMANSAGTRKWINNSDRFWELAKLGIRVCNGPQGGGNQFKEVV